MGRLRKKKVSFRNKSNIQSTTTQFVSSTKGNSINLEELKAALFEHMFSNRENMAEMQMDLYQCISYNSFLLFEGIDTFYGDTLFERFLSYAKYCIVNGFEVSFEKPYTQLSLCSFSILSLFLDLKSIKDKDVTKYSPNHRYFYCNDYTTESVKLLDTVDAKLSVSLTFGDLSVMTFNTFTEMLTNKPLTMIQTYDCINPDVLSSGLTHEQIYSTYLDELLNTDNPNCCIDLSIMSDDISLSLGSFTCVNTMLPINNDNIETSDFSEFLHSLANLRNYPKSIVNLDINIKG